MDVAILTAGRGKVPAKMHDAHASTHGLPPLVPLAAHSLVAGDHQAVACQLAGVGGPALAVVYVRAQGGCQVPLGLPRPLVHQGHRAHHQGGTTYTRGSHDQSKLEQSGVAGVVYSATVVVQ